MYGYLGSVLVAVSLMMNSIVRLRWINLFGAAVFSSYGLMIAAYPVFVLNGFIVLVDIYYLVQMGRKSDYFELLTVDAGNSPFLKLFLDWYGEDIRTFFPGYTKPEEKGDECIFILRNLMPVGLFIYRRNENIADIQVDYVIPQYRDLKNAHFLYRNRHIQLADTGISEFRVQTEVERHRTYLRKVGFQSAGKNAGNGEQFLLKVNNG